MEPPINIFFLSDDPAVCAREHCDQHVRKMLIESAQLLSTAHRQRDGVLTKVLVDLPRFAQPGVEDSNRLVRSRYIGLLPNESASLHGIREAKIDGRYYRIEDADGRSYKRYLDKVQQQQPTTWAWRLELHVKNKQCCLETHALHSSAIWARVSAANYSWLFALYKALNAEFCYRWGKDHACWTNWSSFLQKVPANIKSTLFYDPPQMMPAEFKHASTVQAYRNYYNGEKSKFARWTGRAQPSWYHP